MDKDQKLRNTAEGFMAGLVAAGHEGPFSWHNLEWELAFYDAWQEWEPKDREPKYFRVFEVGGLGRRSEGRELLWQIDKRTSPFRDFKRGLNPQPAGMSAREYLQNRVVGATPDEWVELASAFLRKMKGGAEATNNS